MNILGHCKLFFPVPTQAKKQQLNLTPPLFVVISQIQAKTKIVNGSPSVDESALLLLFLMDERLNSAKLKSSFIREHV